MIYKKRKINLLKFYEKLLMSDCEFFRETIDKFSFSWMEQSAEEQNILYRILRNSREV